ncbi:hypothetical protein LIER_18821 [Lithospermum erythrorhizon]|uniref:Copia protein n=1 Tax=Lithospermum erythrorhizon TaxID=34254 RepID=A0AAV3QGF8_LITER
MAVVACELKWLSFLFQDFQISLSMPIPLRCDNKSAVHIGENPIFQERTKHIELDCHLVRDHYKIGFSLPVHVFSQQQLVDLFTKSLAAPVFSRLLFKMAFLAAAPF